MNLRTALRANGYTMDDLWHRMRSKGCNINRSEIMRAGGATRPGNLPFWNVILTCLDDMGVDW